jgi:hypothetical protein
MTNLPGGPTAIGKRFPHRESAGTFAGVAGGKKKR